jgi:hypothetical protein
VHPRKCHEEPACCAHALGGRERTACESFRKNVPPEELHRQERLGRLIRPVFDQPRRNPVRRTPKTLGLSTQRCDVLLRASARDLDCDRAVGFGKARLEHATVATDA